MAGTVRRNHRITELLDTVVAAHEAAFPAQGLSYYLIGSWVDGATNALSDLDLVVVWPGGTPTNADRELSADVARSLRSDTRLDLVVLGEQEVAASAIGVNLKLSSLLLHGPDLRARLSLPPLEVYAAQTVEAALFFMSRILRGCDVLSTPLDYPDPSGQFFGYDRKRVEEWYPADIKRGLKEWTSTATRLARALVAVQGGQYVGSKGESIARHGSVIADEWSEYLALLYQKGKIEWGYRVPEDAEERHLLRELCRRFLEFERHFLEVCNGDESG